MCVNTNNTYKRIWNTRKYWLINQQYRLAYCHSSFEQLIRIILAADLFKTIIHIIWTIVWLWWKRIIIWNHLYTWTYYDLFPEVPFLLPVWPCASDYKSLEGKINIGICVWFLIEAVLLLCAGRMLEVGGVDFKHCIMMITLTSLGNRDLQLTITKIIDMWTSWCRRELLNK